jgi:hypothetical protein
MKLQKEVNNHIHNTLGITKKEIRDMVMKQAKRIAQKWAEKHVKECISSWDFQKMMREEIAHLKLKGVSEDYMWGGKATRFEDYITKVITTEIKKAIQRRIKFKINVE